MTYTTVLYHLFLIVVGVFGIAYTLNLFTDVRDRKKALDDIEKRLRLTKQREQYNELCEAEKARLERKIASVKARMAEYPASGELDTSRFNDIFPEVSWIGLHRVRGEFDWQFLKKVVLEFREHFVYPVKEAELDLRRCELEYQFAKKLDDPGSIADFRRAIHNLRDRLPRLRADRNRFLHFMRLRLREEIALAGGASTDDAKAMARKQMDEEAFTLSDWEGPAFRMLPGYSH